MRRARAKVAGKSADACIGKCGRPPHVARPPMLALAVAMHVINIGRTQMINMY